MFPGAHCSPGALDQLPWLQGWPFALSQQDVLSAASARRPLGHAMIQSSAKGTVPVLENVQAAL